MGHISVINNQVIVNNFKRNKGGADIWGAGVAGGGAGPAGAAKKAK